MCTKMHRVNNLKFFYFIIIFIYKQAIPSATLTFTQPLYGSYFRIVPTACSGDCSLKVTLMGCDCATGIHLLAYRYFSRWSNFLASTLTAQKMKCTQLISLIFCYKKLFNLRKMTDAKKVTIFSPFKIKYGNMRKNPPPPRYSIFSDFSIYIW